VLSIIPGGGKWVEMTMPADPLASAAERRAAILAPRRNGGEN
jgi:hypothetical protein